MCVRRAQQPAGGVPGGPRVRRQSALLADPALEERDRLLVVGIAAPDLHADLRFDLSHLRIATDLREDARRGHDGEQVVRPVLAYEVDLEREGPQDRLLRSEEHTSEL